MRTNISISPHTYNSREATSQPATKGKNRRGEEDLYVTVTECLMMIMMIINIIMIIVLLLFVCSAVSVIGHWPADTARS